MIDTTFAEKRFSDIVDGMIAELQNVKLQYGIALKRARAAEEAADAWRELQIKTQDKAAGEIWRLRLQLKTRDLGKVDVAGG